MGRINLCGLFNTALELFKVYALFLGWRGTSGVVEKALREER